MMILAGEVAAKYATHHRIPIPYRVQMEPYVPDTEMSKGLHPLVMTWKAITLCRIKEGKMRGFLLLCLVQYQKPLIQRTQ